MPIRRLFGGVGRQRDLFQQFPVGTFGSVVRFHQLRERRLWHTLLQRARIRNERDDRL
jgi:hypothetical protein